MRLQDQFGDIDIYVFDQLLRGRIRPGMRIIDAGCGAGRNLVYLMREGFDVAGADQSPNAVNAVRQLAARLAPALPSDAFRVEAVEHLSFDTASADVVISSAVLHFARDDEHFRAMLDSMWRIIKPGGLLFARLASSIGLPREAFTPLGDRRFTLPDGSERYLVDEQVLMDETERLAGWLVDPLKTTVVQNARCMTTWVLSKAAS